MAHPRRRSNSSSLSKTAQDFKTKFEELEQEPVFEETTMGPESEEGESHLEHQSTTSSDNSTHVVEE